MRKTACKPVAYILGAGGVPPRSVQQNANDAWRAKRLAMEQPEPKEA